MDTISLPSGDNVKTDQSNESVIYRPLSLKSREHFRAILCFPLFFHVIMYPMAAALSEYGFRMIPTVIICNIVLSLPVVLLELWLSEFTQSTFVGSFRFFRVIKNYRHIVFISLLSSTVIAVTASTLSVRAFGCAFEEPLPWHSCPRDDFLNGNCVPFSKYIRICDEVLKRLEFESRRVTNIDNPVVLMYDNHTFAVEYAVADEELRGCVTATVPTFEAFTKQSLEHSGFKQGYIIYLIFVVCFCTVLVSNYKICAHVLTFTVFFPLIVVFAITAQYIYATQDIEDLKDKLYEDLSSDYIDWSLWISAARISLGNHCVGRGIHGTLGCLYPKHQYLSQDVLIMSALHNIFFITIAILTIIIYKDLEYTEKSHGLVSVLEELLKTFDDDPFIQRAMFSASSVVCLGCAVVLFICVNEATREYKPTFIKDWRILSIALTLFFLVVFLSITQVIRHVYVVLDAIYLLSLLLVIVETFAVCRFYGWKRFRFDITRQSTSKPPPFDIKYFKYLWLYLVPSTCMLIICLYISRTIEFGDIDGYMASSFFWLAVIVFIYRYIVIARSGESLKELLEIPDDWGPANAEDRIHYKDIISKSEFGCQMSGKLKRDPPKAADVFVLDLLKTNTSTVPEIEDGVFSPILRARKSSFQLYMEADEASSSRISK